MIDKIFFQNLRFYGYHGVFRHEKLKGQYFELDIELACALKVAGRSGQLADSVDYGLLYQLIKAIVSECSFPLLEVLGECLCEEILDQFPPIENVVLRLRKPEAPLEGGIVADELLGAKIEGCSSEKLSGRFQGEELLGKAPWKSGSFGPGGSVGIELHRSRQDR